MSGLLFSKIEIQHGSVLSETTLGSRGKELGGGSGDGKRKWGKEGGADGC